MPGHVRHKGGDSFSEVYLSYHGTVPAKEFLRDFPPDEKFLYARDDAKVPARFIRAYRTRDPKTGNAGPWQAGMTLDPAVVSEALGEACLLALEYAPGLALPLVRKALLSDVPANRSEVAAILALIDRPWSRRELLAALDRSGDQERTADARAALLEAGGEEVRRTVLAWEERNPHEPEPGHYLEVEGRKVGPFYSTAEVMLRGRRQWVRSEMDRLHDRVMRLRDCTPPDPL